MKEQEIKSSTETLFEPSRFEATSANGPADASASTQSSNPAQSSDPDGAGLAAAIRAWNHLHSGLNTAQFADRMRDEGWQPEGVPVEAFLVLMQAEPYCTRFQQQNGYWYLRSHDEKQDWRGSV